MLRKLYTILPTFMKDSIMRSIVKNGYAKNDYNTVARTRELTEHEESAITTLFNIVKKDNPILLDIGCGDGKLFDTYMYDKGAQITGIDLSARQIYWAKKNLPNCEFLCCDFMKFKVSDKFDLVTAFYSVYNIPRQRHKKLFKKIYSWLKQDGAALLLLRVNGVGDFDYWNNWCGSEMAFSYDDSDKMIKYAKKAGFVVAMKEHKENDEYVWMYLLKM